jgi:hypothetical protein
MIRSLALILVLGIAATASPQEYANGYTYVAPSYYLTPPVVTYPPAYVGGPYYSAQPYVVQQPVYPVPYSVRYRDRVRTSPREVEYRFRGPDGRRQRLEVEYDRWGRVKDVDFHR